MLSLPDRAAIEAALSEPLPSGLRELITGRLSQEIGGHTYDLAGLTHIVVVEPGDSEADLRQEVGFSLLDDPCWDWFQANDGWFEFIVIVGNDGFAFVILIQDDPAIDPKILDLCRSWAARGTSHLI